MDFEQIKELITRLEASKLKKIIYKKGDEELTLEKEESFSHLPPPPPKHSHHEERFHAPEPHLGKGGRKEDPHATYVSSPMVGTFYASPAPDQASFVKVGDRVSPDTIVCIIEAMKVLNEVKAGVSGTVAEILVDNAQPVEFGTKLFRVT